MSLGVSILSVLAALFVLIVTFEMLRRGRLRERHAIWWLSAGIIGFFVALFPSSVDWLSTLLGVEVASNLVFFIAIVTLGFLSLQHSTELTANEDDIRTLTEESAMIREELERLRAQLSREVRRPEND